jgi:hypothetical protein
MNPLEDDIPPGQTGVSLGKSETQPVMLQAIPYHE